ncbi:MAG: addiction module protein [Phycisphaeraceae bacterium]|nr:addiction module protein [Phycisphaeraceae bacterium]
MHPTGHHDFDFSALSVTERIDLAQRLWESVRDSVEAALLTDAEVIEIQGRIAAIDSGLMVCEPFDAAIVRIARR